MTAFEDFMDALRNGEVSNQQLVVAFAMMCELLNVFDTSSSGNGSGETDRLLDTDEAAQMLGIQPQTLYHNKFPFIVKIGGSRRYSLHGIQKYIKRQTSSASR
jgi:predicted DNA-binding transcriptional regulator AlpA